MELSMLDLQIAGGVVVIVLLFVLFALRKRRLALKMRKVATEPVAMVKAEPEAVQIADFPQKEQPDEIVRTAEIAAAHQEVAGSEAETDSPELARLLDLPEVLGWFTLTEFGVVKFSDQVYDPEVPNQFFTMVGQLNASAELVGLAEWSDFTVKGPDGIILIIVVSQSVMAIGGYVVVFLSTEEAVPQVLARFAR